ncbi:exported hypothetical protein [Desulfamplus magnetovallimortis]|uniref:LamG-like jellyroll fold domain-containing protein n=1 Tax=Desulfamplus magnetovallimortis TaxID=1246637 RepID=A0A1W1H5I3_9BACT|nr:LamG domain-containing protein [Desulfamplus magnetovallimortis]SLM27712.1 exported hypothetical protein [Desulfamplus magnetovallimortis]
MRYVNCMALSVLFVFIVSTVVCANQPPEITSTPATTVKQGSAYSYTLTGSDGDGDSLTWSVITKPAWLTLGEEFDTTGLVAHYKLDEDANDSTSYAHHGTINGTITFETGQAVKAARFDGSSAYISLNNITNFPTGSSPYTIAAWVKSDVVREWLGIVGWGNYGTLNQVNALRLGFSLGNSYIRNYWWANDADINIPNVANVWYMIVATWDGTTRKMYLNDEEKYSQPASGLNAQPINGAIARTNYNEYFDGLIDDVKIYNRALSSTELTNLVASVTKVTLFGTPTNNDVGIHNVKLTLSDGTATIEHDFQIEVVDAPTVTIQAVTSIDRTSATGNCSITAINGANATNRGVIYYAYTDTDKTIDDSQVTNIDENGDFGTGAFTASLTGLSVNTRYNARAHATSSNGTNYGSRVDFWTLANVPNAPTVNNPTSTTLDVTVNVNGKPVSTEFCINEISTGNHVQADGTLAPGEVWQTEALWGTKTVTGLTAETTYAFKVKARNGGNTETALGDTASGTTASQWGTPALWTQGDGTQGTPW